MNKRISGIKRNLAKISNKAFRENNATLDELLEFEAINPDEREVINGFLKASKPIFYTFAAYEIISLATLPICHIVSPLVHTANIAYNLLTQNYLMAMINFICAPPTFVQGPALYLPSALLVSGIFYFSKKERKISNPGSIARYFAYATINKLGEKICKSLESTFPEDKRENPQDYFLSLRKNFSFRLFGRGEEMKIETDYLKSLSIRIMDRWLEYAGRNAEYSSNVNSFFPYRIL